jgi:hypothetical protein
MMDETIRQTKVAIENGVKKEISDTLDEDFCTFIKKAYQFRAEFNYRRMKAFS